MARNECHLSSFINLHVWHLNRKQLFIIITEHALYICMQLIISKVTVQYLHRFIVLLDLDVVDQALCTDSNGLVKKK